MANAQQVYVQPSYVPAPAEPAKGQPTANPLYPYPPPGTASAQVYMVPAAPANGVPFPAVPTCQPRTYWPSCPTDADCPGCRAHVTTRTYKKTGLGTWLISLGTCFVGCICGCCLIPFAVDECKDTIHECPKCGRTLGEARLVGL